MSEFDRMVEFLDMAYVLKTDIVPCLVGPVGIGKTAAVKQHAENVGAGKVVTIIASQILPNEVSGITMPDSETKAMEIYDHYRLSSLNDGDILFFDELLEADQLVLSACLTLIESRMLMSGKILPDIQIVAATNPTIQPNVLKENIRQRFMFQRFKLDKEATREYIKKEVGLDVHLLVDLIQETSDHYNILTPRSLTKLAKWVMAVDREQLKSLAKVIDRTWLSQIGTELVQARLNQEGPNLQAKEALLGACEVIAGAEAKEEFKNMDIIEIVSKIKSLNWWDQVEKILSTMDAPKQNV